MSNIAGKAYAMSLLTPIRKNWAWINKGIFWIAGLRLFQRRAFGGLLTLSLIHYARWVIFKASDLPVLDNRRLIKGFIEDWPDAAHVRKRSAHIVPPDRVRVR